MPTPKEESEQLMNSLLTFAERMLKEHQEFYPYGGYMSADGKIVHVSEEKLKERITQNPKKLSTC